MTFSPIAFHQFRVFECTLERSHIEEHPNWRHVKPEYCKQGVSMTCDCESVIFRSVISFLHFQ